MKLILRVLLVLSMMFMFASFAYANDYKNIAKVYDNGQMLVPVENSMLGASTMQIATKEFYKTHQDDFDFLFVLTKATFNLFSHQGKLDGYLPDAFPLQKGPAGTGTSNPKYSPSDFGSSGKLKLVGDLFTFDNYTDKPNDGYVFYSLASPIGNETKQTGYSQVAMVGRAFMKYWGGGLKLPSSGGKDASGIINSKGWWSFFFNSDGSVLGGNTFKDGGNGFTASSSGRSLTDLDLYLLGLKKPADVTQKLYYISGSKSDYNKDSNPDPDAGWLSGGTKVDFTMDDITSTNGTVSSVDQKEYTCAFIAVLPPGLPNENFELKKAEELRYRFEQWILEQTKNKIKFNCRLDGGTVEPVDGDEESDKITGCTKDDLRCDLRIVERCDENHEWVYVKDCGDQLCENGQCVDSLDGDQAADCSVGQMKCSDDSTTVLGCDSGTWVPTTICSNTKQVCDGGKCVDPNEVDGDDDNAPVTIDGDSETGPGTCSSNSDCPENSRCTSSGSCLPCPEGTVLSGNFCTTATADGDEADDDAAGGCNSSGSLPIFALISLLLVAMFIRRKAVS